MKRALGLWLLRLGARWVQQTAPSQVIYPPAPLSADPVFLWTARDIEFAQRTAGRPC